MKDEEKQVFLAVFAAAMIFGRAKDDARAIAQSVIEEAHKLETPVRLP